MSFLSLYLLHSTAICGDERACISTASQSLYTLSVSILSFYEFHTYNPTCFIYPLGSDKVYCLFFFKYSKHKYISFKIVIFYTELLWADLYLYLGKTNWLMHLLYCYIIPYNSLILFEDSFLDFNWLNLSSGYGLCSFTCFPERAAFFPFSTGQNPPVSFPFSTGQ